MKRTVWTFGLASGALSAGVINVCLALAGGYKPVEQQSCVHGSVVVGWTSIVLSALLVFFGVRSYRAREGGGHVGFGRALAVGTLIAVVASGCYAVTWGVVSTWLMPGVTDKMAVCMVEQAKKDGKSDREVAETARQAELLRRIEANPLLKLGEAFIEPFPVGFLAALIAAAILRRKAPSGPAGMTPAAP